MNFVHFNTGAAVTGLIASKSDLLNAKCAEYSLVSVCTESEGDIDVMVS